MHSFSLSPPEGVEAPDIIGEVPSVIAEEGLCTVYVPHIFISLAGNSVLIPTDANNPAPGAWRRDFFLSWTGNGKEMFVFRWFNEGEGYLEFN
ncbi:MAG: hypothetical protein ACLFUZ_01570 [Candidatus Micrarchaeia archaeon]